jgi:hypothetical protein
VLQLGVESPEDLLICYRRGHDVGIFVAECTRYFRTSTCIGGPVKGEGM